MIATPIRWLLMIGVAASGYFMITGNSVDIRAAAFMGSVICWQAHYVVMMWEADMIRSSSKRKCASCGKEEANGRPAANPALGAAQAEGTSA